MLTGLRPPSISEKFKNKVSLVSKKTQIAEQGLNRIDVQIVFGCNFCLKIVTLLI